MTKERYWIYDADGRLRGGIETKEPRASLARKLDRGGFTAVRVSGGATPPVPEALSGQA